jgi:hypothetical protein
MIAAALQVGHEPLTYEQRVAVVEAEGVLFQSTRKKSPVKHSNRLAEGMDALGKVAGNKKLAPKEKRAYRQMVYGSPYSREATPKTEGRGFQGVHRP